MAEEDTAEDNRQFEQVLSRLDALMKRSHASAPVEESGVNVPADEASDVPVLTEIYHGAGLLMVAASEQEAPPLLTEFVAVPQDIPAIEEPVVEAGVVEEQVAEPAVPDPPPLSREQEVEAVLAELMPTLREMIARVAQEEFYYAQQNLMLRVSQEAEQALRLRLLQKPKPK